MTSPPYPLFLDLADQPVLIVGGGAVALRKARGLLESGARITIVSPAFTNGFDKFTEVERLVTTYSSEQMRREPWRLIFAATDNPEVNAKVKRDAAVAGIFCCRCDEPDAGDFFGGAVERLGNKDVTLAISTNGASPMIAQRIREQAAAAIDPMLIQWVEIFSEWRGRVKIEVADAAARRALLERLAGAEMENILRQEGAPAAQSMFEQWSSAARSGDPRPAAVSAETTSRS